AQEADAGDREDRADRDDDVPRVTLEGVDLERGAEVVRHEERRERDHDQVVEEERPAGHEAGEVVHRAAHEGRRAACLPERRRRCGVRERDEKEEEADAEEDERREAERVESDDPEREVDRRGDLAVGDGEERAGVELAAEAGELAGYLRPPRATSRRPAPAGANSSRMRSPIPPDPWASVAATSAIPSATVIVASTTVAMR